MADGVAADAQVPGAPLIRPIPALHLHYANALLAELGQRGPIPLSVLLDEVDDVERLFKSEREHRSPLERARQLMRYAQELGLVRHDGGELSLTDAGLRYVAAIDPAEVFAMTPDQEGILYEQIREGVRAGNGIARGVALTLAILGEQADPDGLPDEALGEVLARRGGMASWREPRTFRSQGRRYRALTQDAGLLRSNKLDQLRGRTVTLTAKEAGMRLGSEAGSRAWIVRAGRNGAYEWLALSEGVSLIGWSELGELPPDLTREALKARIRSTYREQRERSVASQAGQVYRFAQEIAVGDVVVLPLLRDPRHVAVGRVRGGYEHRDDGPFAGVDAQHTRPVEWVAQRVGYNRFDQDLRAAFAQQGTVSEIGAPHAAERILAAAQAGAIHLVLKWSTRLGADTIERHLEVEREHGAVWWGRVSRPGATGLSSKWVDALREQVADGVPTSVFLRGATTWAGRLLAITTDRAEVEEALVPAYYDPATHHSLWVKLTELREVDEGEILSGYVLAQTGNPVTAGGLGNQTPLILRGPPRDTTAIPAGEARAARPEAPTAMPVE